MYVMCLIVNDQFYACLLHEIFRCPPPPQSKKQNKKSSIFVKKSYVSEWVGYFMMRLCVWIFLTLAKKGMPKNHENFKQVFGLCSKICAIYLPPKKIPMPWKKRKINSIHHSLKKYLCSMTTLITKPLSLSTICFYILLHFVCMY